jgi:hypothetical protein
MSRAGREFGGRVNWQRGDPETVYDPLTLLMKECGVSTACDGFGFAPNAAAAFHVFFRLEVTSYHVPYILFDSAPSGSN